MQLKSASFQKKAFTLLELMIGVSIIAVIAAIAIPSFLKYMNDAREAELTQALLQAKRAQDIVIQTHGKAAVLFEGNGMYGDNETFPKLDYRVSSIPKFNLIIGVQNSIPQIVDSADSPNPNIKYRFDQLYPEANLPQNPNNFGVVFRNGAPQPGEYLLGVEANLDGDSAKHVLAIDQNGTLLKFCDDVSNLASASMYSTYGFGDLNCDPSTNGGDSQNSGGGGSD